MYRVKLVAEVSQAPEEEEVVPHVVQLISPPFLGRTVLTAGPAKFGMDLTKQEHGVSFKCDNNTLYSINLKAIFDDDMRIFCKKHAFNDNNITKSKKCYNYITDFSQPMRIFSFTCTSFISIHLRNITTYNNTLKLLQVKGSIVKASPYTACGPMDNAVELKGHIALALRGDCMFAAKARWLQEAGAIGVIFIGEDDYKRS